MRFAYLIEPPFNYRDENGMVTGCDVELSRTILASIGVHEFELVEAEFAELLPGLAKGRWSMTTGLFATDERRKLVTFSRPIWALPDGFLVQKGTPNELTGYASAAESGCVLAVIQGQIQYASAVERGVPDDRILVCDTYNDAAQAVLDGRADAYASVAMAHRGYLAQNPSLPLEVVSIKPAEKSPGYGAFAFAKGDELRQAADAALLSYLGSPEHRDMMRRYGFTDSDVDLVAS